MVALSWRSLSQIAHRLDRKTSSVTQGPLAILLSGLKERLLNRSRSLFTTRGRLFALIAAGYSGWRYRAALHPSAKREKWFRWVGRPPDGLDVPEWRC